MHVCRKAELGACAPMLFAYCATCLYMLTLVTLKQYEVSQLNSSHCHVLLSYTDMQNCSQCIKYKVVHLEFNVQSSFT
jgi:hypothetical protein